MDKKYEGFGYLGDGKYPATEGGKYTEAYSKWVSCVRRCYRDDYVKRKPNYENSYMCDEWRNFQVFAEWYYKNRPNAKNVDYQLDKDFLKSNVYSPSTCLIIPGELNRLILGQKKFKHPEYPLGVSKKEKDLKYTAKITYKDYREDKYGFDTPMDAFNWYKEKKEGLIKQVAKKYRYALTDYSYKIITQYEVMPYPNAG